MGSVRWRVSPFALACALFLAAAAVLGYVFAAHSVDLQNEALLKNDTTQASEYVSSLAANLTASLDSLVPSVAQDGDSTPGFVVQARQLAGIQSTFVLARREDSNYVASAVVGSGFSTGEVLDGPIATTLSRAGAKASPGPVFYDGHLSSFGLAIGPPLVPVGTALYEELHIDPFIAISASQAAPFRALRAAVYATRTQESRFLVLSNTHALPITGERSEVPVSIGSGTWWLVATARTPLAGGFPNAAPLVVLVCGLALAIAFACIIEILNRRQRYADVLVKESTAALLASQEALVRSERFSAMGQMTTVVGHEMRSPLGAVVNAHYMLRRSLGDPEAAEKYLDVAERQITKAVSLAQDLIEYMRERPPVLESIRLGEVLAEVLETSPPPENITLRQEGMSVVLRADFSQLVQVLGNVIDNAYQAMPRGGSIRVVAHGEDGVTVIRVENSGEGIDPATSERLFEPFFTTRSTGTGLGLAIVRRLTEAHGGSVSIENSASGGVVVTLRLPMEAA